MYPESKVIGKCFFPVMNIFKGSCVCVGNGHFPIGRLNNNRVSKRVSIDINGFERSYVRRSFINSKSAVAGDRYIVFRGNDNINGGDIRVILSVICFEGKTVGGSF